MGCGSSRSYPYEVSQQWESVEKTIESRGRQNRVTIRRSGWKTVRVFVSSTFRDFHSERDVLVKEVFPDLREWCEKRRLHLVECDLRWGVPKDTTTEETLRTCLSEIDRCYQENIMPFFLNMTSERCGWIPGLEEVPSSVVSDYRWIHGLSITEMEIMHGAYRKENPNSLFALRDDSFIDQIPQNYREEFVDSNPIATHKLKMLKEMLQTRFGMDKVFKYSCSYNGIDIDSGKVELDGLDDFKVKVFDFFKKAVAEQYPLDESRQLDPYEQDKEAHESFMKSRSSILLGRKDILEKIESYILDKEKCSALILLGGPGSGKSSLLARVADVACLRAAKGEIPSGQGPWNIFYHFVGAIPGSTNPEKMIKRLLRELKVCNDSNMPKDYESACQIASSALSNPNTKPTIIVIDALNQLDEDRTASTLRWLPSKLAPQVRCVFSMINETPPHRMLRERKIKPVELPVTPLDMESRREIVSEMLGQFNKRLDEEQMVSLLSKEASQNPLWLSIACEELRVYGVFAKVTDKINTLADGLLELLAQVLERFEDESGGSLMVATLCLLECSSSGLLEAELLAILGDEDNLMPSDDGENNKEKGASEKREKSNKLQPLPAVKWARVYRALRPFLRPFGDSGEGRLDFYHRSLSKAIRKKYFNARLAGEGEGYEEEEEGQAAMNETLVRWWNTKLADYFENVSNLERKVEEYPYQLIKLGDKKRLTECICDWDMIEGLYNEDYSSQLLSYWRKMDEKYDTMASKYTEMSAAMSIDDPKKTADKLSCLAHTLTQAGQYKAAQGIINKVLEIETEQLDSEPERLVELYDLCGELFDEIAKLHDFITREQISDLRPAIDYCRKAVAIRETLEGPSHKFRLANTLMRLAFGLNTWMECGGDNTLSPAEAYDESKKRIETSIQMFKEIGDLGKEAEASMTKAILFERGSEEQKEWYQIALEQCQQAFGENCKLMTRIVSNTGIYYEDIQDYHTAYDYFVKWHQLCVEVFGEGHPRTISSTSCLNEPRYVQIANAKSVTDQLHDTNIEDEHHHEGDDDDDDEY
ncbi:telomerase protein component 1 [Strongylocentrotus purpuratus]|uniref:NACHT domain-containing protein n=1 Tax=Strongylocentrotus purpuratus TaxID=7668 RepID=A0A7M7NXZ9_STRPU|nr:telomerase protein component 1 [Strongylocentrotus purpuratus]|eukprot:XP_001186817.2 PREDICTED: telomerase protein component 1 [Strongylocentrotus purpuratus]